MKLEEFGLALHFHQSIMAQNLEIDNFNQHNLTVFILAWRYSVISTSLAKNPWT